MWAWGIRESKGSSVRSSIDSEANIMLVVPPDVPIYGWLVPATSLLSHSFSEGQCRRRLDHRPMVYTNTDLLFGKAILPLVLIQPFPSQGVRQP